MIKIFAAVLIILSAAVGMFMPPFGNTGSNFVLMLCIIASLFLILLDD